MATHVHLGRVKLARGVKPATTMWYHPATGCYPPSIEAEGFARVLRLARDDFLDLCSSRTEGIGEGTWMVARPRRGGSWFAPGPKGKAASRR